jgi:hypothetical protein
MLIINCMLLMRELIERVNRTDYETGSPRPEKLNDFELGLRHATK